MRRLMLFALPGLLIASAAMAAVPNTMNVQGRLLNAGSPMTGSHPADFKIYDAASAGNLLWAESSSLIVQGGIFTAIIGSTTPIPTIVFDSQPRWLEVTVDGTTLNPRLLLTTSAYAFRAQRSDTATVALNGVMTGGQWESNGTDVWRGSGKVGIGISNPVFTLDVAGGDSRFQREIGSTDFIVSATPTDVRLFSQANVPVTIGTNGDTYKLSIQGDGRINVKNALGIGPSTPWSDNGIFLDASSQTSQIAWDNRASAGFQMYQSVNSNVFNFSSSGGGSTETWNFVSAGLGTLLTIGSQSNFNRSLGVSNNLNVGGNLFVGGTKCRVVKTTHGELTMNAIESAHALFMDDEPSARLVSGRCRVNLSSKFLATVTVNGKYPLAVNVTFYGRHSGEWYVERDATGFNVIDPSGSDAEFSWQVIARQRDYEDIYLEPVTLTAQK